MKKLAFLGGAAGLGVMALLISPRSQAADHADVLATTATKPMADINDLYAWMTSDATKVNLALTVSPFDDGSHAFDASVQYVFHLSRYAFASAADFPVSPTQVATGEESKVVCTFTSNTAGKCWVIDPAGKTLDYVEGDLSGSTGKASVGGKFRVFAGRRSDPFFFNLAGFAAAQRTIVGACDNPGTVGTVENCPGVLDTLDDDAHCPSGLPAATVMGVAGMLSSQQTTMLPPGCTDTEKDCFKGKKVMAIVVQVDKDLIVTDTKPLVSVWASTHAGQ